MGEGYAAWVKHRSSVGRRLGGVGQVWVRHGKKAWQHGSSFAAWVRRGKKGLGSVGDRRGEETKRKRG